MNEEELLKFSENLMDQCDKKDLGIAFVLATKDGILCVNHFPKWSVLQYDEELKRITLHKTAEDTPDSWFEKVNLTLSFLHAVSEHYDELGSLAGVLKNTLEDVLEDSFKEETKQPNTIH